MINTQPIKRDITTKALLLLLIFLPVATVVFWPFATTEQQEQEHVPKIIDLDDSTVETLKSTGEDAFARSSAAIDNVVDEVKKVTQNVASATKNVILENAFDRDAGDQTTSIFNKAEEHVPMTAASSERVKSAMDGLKESAASTGQQAKDTLTSTKLQVQDAAEDATRTAQDKFQNDNVKVMATFQDRVAGAKDGVVDAIDLMQTKTAEATEFVKDIYAEATETVEEVEVDAKDSAAEKMTVAANAESEIEETVSEAVKEIEKTVAEAIKTTQTMEKNLRHTKKGGTNTMDEDKDKAGGILGEEATWKEAIMFE